MTWILNHHVFNALAILWIIFCWWRTEANFFFPSRLLRYLVRVVLALLILSNLLIIGGAI